VDAVTLRGYGAEDIPPFVRGHQGISVGYPPPPPMPTDVNLNVFSLTREVALLQRRVSTYDARLAIQGGELMGLCCELRVHKAFCAVLGQWSAQTQDDSIMGQLVGHGGGSRLDIRNL
jgi:hypothetical protein